ncbi:MAG: hypothetical protein PHN37_02455 [Candidatus Pacebacteria bacterium]|nr:hypothetical protein [Candidatus Paceibacterota bacterium]
MIKKIILGILIWLITGLIIFVLVRVVTTLCQSEECGLFTGIFIVPFFVLLIPGFLAYKFAGLIELNQKSTIQCSFIWALVGFVFFVFAGLIFFNSFEDISVILMIALNPLSILSYLIVYFMPVLRDKKTKRYKKI